MQTKLALLVVLAVGAAAHSAEPAAVDFEREIRPLFTKHCVVCHGVGDQNGGLRLDARKLALQGGDSGAVIAPGKPDESELLQRVVSDDHDLRMPPEGERLSADEIDHLRRWIAAGAVWEETDVDRAAEQQNHKRDHWAWRPVVRQTPPALGPSNWARGEVDQFLLARLQAEQLSPAAEADRRALIRRLSFDLRGLPPTPEEVQAFCEDDDPQAYDRLVDRYLASPAYGPRWARHWLDVVRFAESNGFEMNQARPNAWRYRDYVIQAFNDDLSYDQFIREQLAGDRLGQDPATGFLVAGPWDQVKSPDPVLTAQQRADELHDMVSTTGSAFLGLTVGCARCHDHKFDPIAARDYYAMTACLAGVQHGERKFRPATQQTTPAEIEQLREQLAFVEQELASFEPLAQPRPTLVLDELGDGVEELLPRQNVEPYRAGTARGDRDDAGDIGRWPTLTPSYTWYRAEAHQNVMAWGPRVAGTWQIWVSWGSGFDSHAKDAVYLIDRDGDLWTTVDQAEIARVDQRFFADGTGDMAGQRLWSGLSGAGRHELLPESRILLRNGHQATPVTADLIVLQQAHDESETAHLRAPVWRGANVDRFHPIQARFVRLTVLATNSIEPCIDEWEIFTSGPHPQNVALAAAGTNVAASGSMTGIPIHQLPHIHDGRYGNEASWISNEVGRGWVQYEFAAPQTIDRSVWSRDRGTPARYADRVATSYRIDASLDGVTWQVVASSADRLPTVDANVERPVLTLPGATAEQQRRSHDLLAQRESLTRRYRQLTDLPSAYLGRFEQPGPTYRLHRGDPLAPRETVAAGGIAGFGAAWQLPAETAEADRRQALADWIASPEHPLTARVMVNRLWHYHFGTGLVATPSDFGVNGAPPSHPELLDWLASELIRSDWSIKHVQRLIVQSAAYRQSGESRADGQAADAACRLLWRFPARRLEAEPLRDAILQVCGNLDDRMEGPGFDLFESNGNYVKVYAPRREFGPTEWRRMVYQSKPRMQLDDVFGAFDCPDMGQIAPRRMTSTTPLQALNLLNSPFVLQQSAIMAERLRRDAGGDVALQVERAFELMYQRAPTAAERAACTDFVTAQGLELLVRVLINSNEFLYVF